MFSETDNVKIFELKITNDIEFHRQRGTILTWKGKDEEEDDDEEVEEERERMPLLSRRRKKKRQLSSSSCWMTAALAVPPTFQLRFAGIQFGDGAGPQRGQFRCRGKGHGPPHLLLKATNVVPLLHSKQRHRAREKTRRQKKTSKTVQRHRPAWHRQAGRMPVSTPLCNVNPQTKWAYLCSVQQKRKLKNKRKEEEGKNERCCPPLLAFTINRVGQPAQPIPKEVAGSNVSPDTPSFYT